MIRDTVIILAVILILMIIIAVFGGCVRCNNNYTREMYTVGADTTTKPTPPPQPKALPEPAPLGEGQAFLGGGSVSGATIGPGLAETAAPLS